MTKSKFDFIRSIKLQIKDIVVLVAITFLSIFLCVFSFAKGASADTTPRTVRVGLYDNPPKEYLDSSGNAKGLFPDVLNYIAKQENWKIQYVMGTFDED